MTVIRRKVIKYGNSFAITLPIDLLREKGLSKSKYVYLRLLDESQIKKMEDYVNEHL